MSPQGIARKAGMVCLLGAGILLCTREGLGGPLQIGSFCCCPHICPHHYVHCTEGRPKIKFKCGCPKPVCGPCMLEHYGYYRTCWQPWPYAPDWSHCPVPPPGDMAAAGMLPPGATIMSETVTPLPAPTKFGGPSSARSLYRDDN